MKFSLLLLMGALAAISNVHAQMGQGDNVVQALNRDLKMTVVSTGGSMEAGSTFSGSVFYNNEWEKGYVRLSDNTLVSDLSLKLNAYTNELYLNRDGKIMVLNDAAASVAEFGLTDPDGAKVFRRGYPAAAANTTKTFYEVVASGKLSLLKLHAKHIVEKRDINRVPVQEMTDAESYYVFDSASNRTIETRHNKNALIEALPARADAIQTIIRDKKLKMRSDEDWVTLFGELNR
jgi:hypothetical protein